MRVLGIETSCDETAVAIYCSNYGLLAHSLFSQIELHSIYGGVVPELASRDHVKRLLPLITQVLDEAYLNPSDINAIAYTKGPGLVGALLTGATCAKSLAFAWDIPALGVHHLEGHLLAPMLETSKPQLPSIALLISGGHTMLIKVKDIGKYELLGESLDDACGEAFDKTAKLLGFGYPGGPKIEIAARQGKKRFVFPRPMLNRPDFNFSFSGLKTHVLTVWNNCIAQNITDEQTKCDIAHEFQEAVFEVLAAKCKNALEKNNINNLVVAGGVSANCALRAKLANYIGNDCVFYPRLDFCTDNGAMIAYAGCQRLLQGESEGLKIEVKARWDLTTV